MPRKVLLVLMIATLAGLLVAGVSLAHKKALVSGAFCTIGAAFNCDIVNQGSYSEIGGVSVALIGVVGYLFLLLAALLKWKKPADRSLTLFLILAAAGGFLFSLYLTSLEAFVLETWCLLCLTSQTIIIIILGCAVWLFYHEKKSV